MSHDRSRSDSGEFYKSRYGNKIVVGLFPKQRPLFFNFLHTFENRLRTNWCLKCLGPTVLWATSGIGEPFACWENNRIHSISRKVLDCPVKASCFLYSICMLVPHIAGPLPLHQAKWHIWGEKLYRSNEKCRRACRFALSLTNGQSMAMAIKSRWGLWSKIIGVYLHVPYFLCSEFRYWCLGMTFDQIDLKYVFSQKTDRLTFS